MSLNAAPQTHAESRNWRGLGTVIVIALAVRIALVPLYARLPGGFNDEDFWKQWMLAIHDHGILNIFRATDTDYVGYQWVLWFLASIYDLIGGTYTQTSPPLHALVKAPSIAFDLLMIVVVYEATRLLHDETAGAGASNATRRERAALTAAAVLAVQPAVLYDGAIWAQTDACVTAAMLGAIVLVAVHRPALGWSVWTAGFLVKPHPIIVVPILIVLTLRTDGKLGLLRGVVAGVAVAGLILGPWIAHGDLGRIIATYHRLFTADYERLSSSAWNLWWFTDVAAHPRPGDTVFGSLTYRMLGLMLSSAAGALALLCALGLPPIRGALLASAYTACAFYVLPISTHERYLYPFLALMLPVVVTDRRWLWLYAGFSTTLFLNLVVVAPPIAAFTGRWVESPFSLAIAAVNVTLFALFTGAVVLVVRQTFASRAPARAVRPGRAPEYL